ncbi:MAG: hypothetical protein CFK52_01630 [Chloracidobacterium sp. CP2_5A]|nr:MAG: hypothetical protein CFK52_01630 [Chloracidobacterium sp. CP2_5A]
MTPAARRWIRFLALTGALVTTAYLISHFVARRTPPKRSEEARRALAPDIEVVSSDFQYVHKEGDVTRLILQAKRDTAFVDGRHKLEGVELQTFNAQGQPTGKLTANNCDYDPAARVSDFRGNVVVATAQGLTVKTEALRYDRDAESAETSELTQFARGRVSGEAVGVRFDGQADRLVLEKAVRVTVAPEKPEQPTSVITAGKAEYLAQEKRLALSGGAKVAQRGDSLSAQTMTAQLDEAQRLRRVEAQAGATLQSSEKAFVLTAQALAFDFDLAGGLTRAVGTGQSALRQQSETERREVFADRLEAEFVRGASASDIASAQATGNARLQIEPVDASPASAPEQKIIRANALRVAFAPGGRVMQSAVADGAATLSVLPLAPTPRSETKTIRAPRFDAVFYPDGKLQACAAAGGVEMVAEPSLPSAGRPPRKTTSERAEADFDAARGDLTRIAQIGNVAFEEGPRHALAERATFLRAREVVELRGESRRPVVWDDEARAEARELDLSTAGRSHVARGDVRTTYYDARRAGSAGFFGQPGAPVFITAREARAESDRAVFMGDARCWQDDSFARGDRLEISKADRRMTVTGQVSTAFYRVARPAMGKSADGSRPASSDAPVFGSARAFTYSDVERRARYAGDVKLAQGDATLTADVVDVDLAPRENRLERLTATGRAVIVQPGRRAAGDVIRYTAADDRYVVTGNLARVEDAERGVSTAPEVSFAKSEGVVRASGGASPQRVRSTYQPKP